MSAIKAGWYLVDRETVQVLRGPYGSAKTAGAVRAEIERNPNEERNIWVVPARTLAAWQAELSKQ